LVQNVQRGHYEVAAELPAPRQLAVAFAELAMRSSLAGSLPVEVPDLRRPAVRRVRAADDWFPNLPEL
jgi:hypothetical protein